MNKIEARIGQALSHIRERHPLIHHITNLVVMNDTANVTLHLGALPVMAYATEEVAEMVSGADALILNVGTLTPSLVESMIVAGRTANERGVPIILDPVGAGATTLRTESSLRLLEELEVAVLRGNGGEIASLSEASGVSKAWGLRGGGAVRGVESVAGGDDPVALGRAMAREYDLTVAITGKRDIVSDGQRTLGVDNGHRWLTTITGSGCMATTAVAAFAAVEEDHLVAAVGGLACFGLAGELAAQKAEGPASFKVALLDQIYGLTADELAEEARITAVEAGSS
ncbi:MAG: hydroxyethylthiazole kinase [Chloroflexota bacterium]|nr:hydroxyethylthiazole kinase [Chloroflexota bacterium]